MHPLINIGVIAARKAGELMLRSLERLDTLRIEKKGAHDYVTNVDKAAEEAIIFIIRKSYPDHDIIGEESGLLEGTPSESNRFRHDKITWVIDPIDGTTNYMHGYPHFCVSIGILNHQKMEHAIIYDPFKDELFTSSRGCGAHLNDRRLRVTPHGQIEGALLTTGFPIQKHESDGEYATHLQKHLAMMSVLGPKIAGLRRSGSAALDLAYVAAGRLDAFWDPHLKIWDMAAGALMIREAGGVVSGLDGLDTFLESGHVIGGNLKIHQQLLALIHTHYPEYKVID